MQETIVQQHYKKLYYNWYFKKPYILLLFFLLMRSYQIIILIGTILGILIVIGSSMFLEMRSHMATDMPLEEQNIFFMVKRV